MEKDIYERLFEHYNNTPWTRAGCTEEIMEIYRLTFTLEEAELALHLEFPEELGGKGRFKTAADIAQEMGKDEREVARMLDNMVVRCCVVKLEMEGKAFYATMGFSVMCDAYQGVDASKVPGGSIDKAQKLGALWTKYFGLGPDDVPEASHLKEFASDYPIQRVLSVEDALDPEAEVLPFERVSQILDNAKVISVIQSPCRKRHARFTGCEKPIEVTVVLDLLANAYITSYRTRVITKEEALELLKLGHDHGLVTLTLNTQSGPGQVMNLCQCCNDCCNFLAPYVRTADPRSIAKSNYLPRIDAGKCNFCKRCVEVCPVRAMFYHAPYKLDRSDETIHVVEERCIGCGLCAHNCPEGAIKLVKARDVVPVETLKEMILKYNEGRIF